MDSLDITSEQINLRYRGTYVFTDRGTPVYIRELYYEEGDSHELVLTVRADTQTGRRQNYTESQIVWEVWPAHHVLFSPAWGGVIVWEKTGQRQIKKAPCETSFSIVGGHYIVNPLATRHGWFSILRAMRSSVHYDVDTAREMLADDESLSAVAISPNSYITREGDVFYHTRRLGSLEEARQHRLWRIINKEAGGL